MESKPSVRDFREWMKQRPQKQTPTTSKLQRVASNITATISLAVEEQNEMHSSFYEHSLTLQQLADAYPLSRINIEHPLKSHGMNQDEAISALVEKGKNVIAPTDSRSALCIWVVQFLHMFRILMLATAILCLVIFCLDTTKVSQICLAAVIFAVLIGMGYLSFHQEKKAIKQMRGFQTIDVTYCHVIRNGLTSRIMSDALVVGDLVKITPGNRIPADIRLFSADNCILDTSWISGEIEPLEFFDAPVSPETSALDAQNIAFCGCQCISGEAIGVVIRTGNDTVLGRLLTLTYQGNKEVSRLEKEHQRFCYFVGSLSLIMATGIFILGSVVSHLTNMLQVFINGFLTVIVANLPQGLPVTLTAQLVIVARRLAKSSLFLKKLEYSETMGTLSVILCDKTGVLTANNISVTRLWFCGRSHKLETLVASPSTLIDRGSLSSFSRPISRLLETMAMCNRAQIDNLVSIHKMSRSGCINKAISSSTSMRKFSEISREKFSFFLHSETNLAKSMGHVHFTGQPTEKAILRAVETLTPIIDIRMTYDVVFEVPFNKNRRWNLIVARKKDDEDADADPDEIVTFYAFLKGAPEDIVKMCSHMSTENGDILMNDEMLQKFTTAYVDIARQGHSSIAFASLTFESFAETEFSVQRENFPCEGFAMLGLCALSDPPRVDTRDQIRKAVDAGIKIHMVTGDHPRAAATVSEIVGMGPQAEAFVVSGDMFDSLSEDEWDFLLNQMCIIYARTTPQQKHALVEKYKKRNEVVCVTGDGILDAPALRAAHIGVAINGTGGFIVKEAAHVIAYDGNLRHLMFGVEYGRLLFENLKKTIAFTLSHLLPELISVLLTFVLGWPLPLTTMQVLTIDLLIELPPAICLIFESAERDLMKKMPRKNRQHLVSRSLLAYSYVFSGIIISTGCILAYLSVFWYYGISIHDLLYSVQHHWYEGADKLLTENGFLYDGHNQEKIHHQACGAFHIALVGTQIFHLLNCRTRRSSIFSHNLPGSEMLLAILISLLFLCSCVYLPVLNVMVGAEAPPSFTWAFPVVTGIILTVFNEVRKYFIRQYPKHNIVRLFKW